MNVYPFPVQSNDPHYDQFMKRTLGTYLPACMREVTETRPEDPIEYISRWLVRATNTDLYLKERAKYLKKLFFTNEAIKASRLEFEAKIQPLKDAAREENETLIQAQVDELEAILHIVEMRGNRPLDNYTKSRLKHLQTVFPNDLRLREVIFLKVLKTKPSILVEEARRMTLEKDKIMKEIEKEFEEGEDQGEDEGESRVKVDGADSDIESMPSKASRKSRSRSSGSRKSRKDESLHDEDETEDSRVPEESSRKRKPRKKKAALEKEEAEDTRVQEGTSKRRKGRKKRASLGKEELEVAEEADVSSTPSDPEIKRAVWEIREAIEKKQIQLTPTGLIAYVTKDLDVIPPKTPRTKPEHPIDTPELWASSQFHCEVLYDHEVYSRCDVDKDKPFKYTKNFPKMTVEDFLAPVNTISRPAEKKGEKKDPVVKSSEVLKSRGAGKSKKGKKQRGE